MDRIQYAEYVRRRTDMNCLPDAGMHRVKQMLEAVADAYGYLAGIDATALALADDVVSNRVACAMDSLVEAAAYVGVDIRKYVIK